jgi:two-component system chemotaxis response regulator CheB
MRPAPAYRAVVIGCSTGGLHALVTLLGGLRTDFPAPLVVVCHSASDDSELLCSLLAAACPLPVREAGEREPVLPGVVHLAPPGYHLLIERDGRFMLSVDPKVCYVRPAADVTFASAADAWGEDLIAVVLTGANDDGASGLRQVRERGGYALVQSPDEAEAPQMPRAALELAGANEVLPLAAIAARLNELCC